MAEVTSKSYVWNCMDPPGLTPEGRVVIETIVCGSWMAVSLAMTIKVDHSTARSSKESRRHAEQGMAGRARSPITTAATTRNPGMNRILTSVSTMTNDHNDKRPNEKIIDFILPI
jgi:hypothetical protein